MAVVLDLAVLREDNGDVLLWRTSLPGLVDGKQSIPHFHHPSPFLPPTTPFRLPMESQVICPLPSEPPSVPDLEVERATFHTWYQTFSLRGTRKALVLFFVDLTEYLCSGMLDGLVPTSKPTMNSPNIFPFSRPPNRLT